LLLEELLSLKSFNITDELGLLFNLNYINLLGENSRLTYGYKTYLAFAI
jgi:hypothetical protein